MGRGPASRNTLAFNVDKVREAMLAQVAIPPDLVNEALRVTRESLDATETKFFAHRGQVVARRNVVAHEVRLRAADQVYSMANLYARDRERAVQPSVALTVDPVSGVVSLIVGETQIENGPALPVAMQEPLEAAPATVQNHVVDVPEEDYVVFKKLPVGRLAHLYNELMND